MFTKNNLKYIAILALGFFVCSSLYLTEEQYLLNFASENFVNIVELLFGSLSMFFGILIFGILYRKNKNVKMLYTIFMFLSIVLMTMFFATKNIYIMSICMCLACLINTAGFGAGYHFSLLSLKVDTKYRGRVFAVGYAIGSIGTYLMILLPEKVYSSIIAILIYIPFLLINLYLVLNKTEMDEIIKENYTSSFKGYFFKVCILVLIMSLLSALSTDVIGYYTINVSGGYGSTRLYYCIGLLVAGFLVDKKGKLFEVLTIVSFIFSLLSIILLKDGYSIKLIAGLSYLFVAFFVLFRTMIFVNMVDKKKTIVFASAFGLMFSRFMEGLLVLFEGYLMNHYTFLIIVIMICLSVVIILYFLLYFESSTNENDVIKSLSVKYKLSIQEEKVLTLLVQGLTNKEIADKLYLSVNTVRNHTASIYKKTGMKKKELREKFYLRTM